MTNPAVPGTAPIADSMSERLAVPPDAPLRKMPVTMAATVAGESQNARQRAIAALNGTRSNQYSHGGNTVGINHWMDIQKTKKPLL